MVASEGRKITLLRQKFANREKYLSADRAEIIIKLKKLKRQFLSTKK